MINGIQQKILLSPKYDVVFQKLFGEEGNENITKELLKTILNEEITDIDLGRTQMLKRETINNKLSVLDVVAKINKNENCDIEMQMINHGNLVERILYYWGKMYVKELNKGEDYTILERTIVILLTNENLKDLKELKYHTKWKIIEDEYRTKVLTEKFELHIIELEKLEEIEGCNEDKLKEWIQFIKDPESEGVKKIMEKNEVIKEAKQKLEEISEDEEMQELAWIRKSAIYEENTLKKNAYNEGEQKGIKQGIKQGKKEEKLEIAKNMKNKNFPIIVIMEVTRLTKKEIEKL